MALVDQLLLLLLLLLLLTDIAESADNGIARIPVWTTNFSLVTLMDNVTLAAPSVGEPLVLSLLAEPDCALAITLRPAPMQELSPVLKTDDAGAIAPDQFAVPIITRISQASFAVEGGSNSFLVEGYGVAATYADAPPNACRLQPRPGESAWTHVSGFLNDARTVIELNSTVVHANTTCKPGCFKAPANRSCCLAVVRCDAPPAVIVPGPGSLSGVYNNALSIFCQRLSSLKAELLKHVFVSLT